jgi:predicted Zn-dependent peptidase
VDRLQHHPGGGIETRLGRAELTLGEFTDVDETLRRLEAVSAGDVRDLAAELASRPLSIAAVGAVDTDALAALDGEPAAA